MGKVAVVGAAGGIGQPLSMLLKLHVAPDVLSLYDVSPAAPGVAADVSHCNTNGKVSCQPTHSQRFAVVFCVVGRNFPLFPLHSVLNCVLARCVCVIRRWVTPVLPRWTRR